jgi:hypothetical protein
MWNVIISWATTIISTVQILYYKYYPSPLAQRQLEEEEQPSQQQQLQEDRQVQDRVQVQVFEMSEQNNNDIYFYQNRFVQLN